MVVFLSEISQIVKFVSRSQLFSRCLKKQFCPNVSKSTLFFIRKKKNLGQNLRKFFGLKRFLIFGKNRNLWLKWV